MAGKSARTCLFGFDGSAATIRDRLADIGGIYVVSDDQARTVDKNLDVDIALVNLEGAGGLDTVKRLALHLAGVKIIGVGSSDPTQIITAMRAGCCQFVTTPIDDNDLRNAIASARPAQNRNSKRICVIGTSSGAGATTVLCNLAVELAHLPASVAVMDLDVEFGGVASAFDVEPNYTIADLCTTDSVETLDPQVVTQAMQESCGVSILARPNDMSQVHQVDPEAVAKTLELMGQSFDFVLVDLSRINGLLGLSAIRNADAVLIVVQPNVMCARNADRAHRIVLNEGVDSKNVWVVLNRARSAGNVESTEFEGVLKAPIIGQIPNDYTSVSMSLDTGFASAEAGGTVRQAVREIAHRIAGVQAQADKSGGLFRRLFGKDKKKPITA